MSAIKPDMTQGATVGLGPRNAGFALPKNIKDLGNIAKLKLTVCCLTGPIPDKLGDLPS